MTHDPTPVGEITCREAGRRGGEATLARYGPAHFAEMARKAPRRDPAALRAAARKGGEATKATYPPEHFERIGRLGGEVVRARYGKAHYAAAGAKSHPRGTT